MLLAVWIDEKTCFAIEKAVFSIVLSKKYRFQTAQLLRIDRVVLNILLFARDNLPLYHYGSFSAVDRDHVAGL